MFPCPLRTFSSWLIAIQVNSRCIIDAEMYNRYNVHDSIPLEPLGSVSFTPKVPAEVVSQGLVLCPTRGYLANYSTAQEPLHHDLQYMSHPPPPPLPPGMGYPPPPPPPPQRPSHSGPKGKRRPKRRIVDERPTYELRNLEPKLLSEDLYPICSPTVRGYALKTKNWGMCIHA